MSLSDVLYGDRLLVSVFAQFRPESRFKLFDPSGVVAAFLKARATGKYSSIFENVPFDNDGIEPRSSVIEDGINALQEARLIGRFNPDLREYKITSGIRVRFDRFIRPELDDQDLEMIRELSNDIRETLDIEE